MTARRILVHEGDAGGARITATAVAEPDQRVLVGREGEVPVGVRVPNRGISRSALVVTPTTAGWRIEVCNRNGAVLHPWGQPAQLATADDTVNWPLVGVRLRHHPDTTRHWVLLVADDLAVTPVGPMGDVSENTETDRARRPSALPPAEREALTVVFGELLAWPPRHPATPLLLKQAAARIGISVSGVQDRLKAARRRAERLGMPGEVPLADPSYLYALVRGGYLTPPRADGSSAATPLRLGAPERGPR